MGKTVLSFIAVLLICTAALGQSSYLWHFDENSGTIAHSSGNTCDLTLSDGATWYAPGWNNSTSCVQLQNIAKVSANPSALIGNGWDSLYISARVNPTIFNANENPIVERYEYYLTNPAYYLTISPTGQVVAGVYLNNGSYVAVTTGNVISPNTGFHHIELYWRSGIELWVKVDGIVAGSVTSPIASVRTSTHPLTVGWFHDIGYGNFYFTGKIDEVIIQNHLPVENDYVWHFDENSGSIAHSSGGTCDLTLSDGAVWYTPGWNNSTSCVLLQNEAKLSADTTMLVGNGWDSLYISACVYPTFLNEDENPIVERYEYYLTNPAYYLTIDPAGRVIAGVYLSNGSYVSVTTDTVIGLNAWSHIEMYWRSGLQLWVKVNGNLVGSNSSPIASVRTSDHRLTVGWFADDLYGDFFFTGRIDEVTITDHHAAPQLDVSLTPISLPIVIPANGGSFDFNGSVVNHGPNQNTFYVWARMKDSNGFYTLNPTLGPVPINPPVNVTVTRLRTQNIPNTWPSGVSTYLAYANWTYTYPALDSSWFTFTKLATSDGGPTVWDAVCYGEPFPGEVMLAEEGLPSTFGLAQAAPNPFNPTTAINYELQAASFVSLKVYDTAGRLVCTLADGYREAGQHQVTFDGSNLASGVYLYTLMAGTNSASGKMLLLK